MTLPLLLLVLAALPARGDEKPRTPAAVADEVLAATGAEDQAALASLAAQDAPDPWLVADELLGRGAYDVAEAFARAKLRADVETLPAYVAAARARGAEKDVRALLDEVNTALRARQAQKALERTEKLPDLVTVPRIRLLHARGLALRVMGRAKESGTAMRRAADAAEALGWLVRANALLHEAGMTAAGSGAWDLALSSWQASLALQERRGDKAGAGRTCNNLGLVQRELGDLDKAMARFEQALETAKAIDDQGLAATVLGNAGIIHELNGNLAKALATYKRALKQKRALGDKRGATVTLSNIGAVQDAQGNYGKALSTYGRARDERQALGDRRGAAQSLGDIGSAHHALGDYAKALTSYEQAIALQEALGDAGGMADTLGNLSGLFFELGNYEKALSIGERTLALKEERGDRAGAAVSLGNVALILAAMGDEDEARTLYEKALASLEALGLRRSAVGMMGNLALTHHRLGDHEKALTMLARALEQTKAMKDRAGTAATLQAMAQVHRATGGETQAIEALKQSARLARRLRARALHVAALRGLAEIHLAQGDSAQALSAAQKALTAMEGLLGGLGEEQGATAREMHARLFAIGTLAAIREDDAAEALTFLESGRAGALLDALGKREEMRWKAETLSPELLEADGSARAAETVARQKYDRAARSGDLEEVRAASKALDAASDGVRTVAARLQRELKQQAQLFYPRAETIEAIEAALTEDQAMVLYGLCLGETLALVLRPEGERIVSLGKTSAVTAACEALDASDPRTEAASDLATVRKLLVEPLKLDKAVKQVLVSPEGPLCYLPFGALFEQTVAMTPSGTTHVLLRELQREPGTGILALGDPDYDGISEGAQAIYYRGRTLSPLPASRKEVETIGTKTLVGAEASESNLRAALATSDGWRAVHFACHGLVNVERPMLSALALSRKGDHDGFVTALEILRMRIPADLAVLSACETATGRIVKGEGIVGLTRAFMFAGAPRVIASLWKVDDEATQALMIKFYELWAPPARVGDPERPQDVEGAERSGLGAAAALKQAQAFVRSHDKWKHPFYWAAWVLWGLPE